MTEKELQEYLRLEYPQENEKCEWKEFHNLKNMFSGNEGQDVVSYVSAISNMWRRACHRSRRPDIAYCRDRLFKTYF